MMIALPLGIFISTFILAVRGKTLRFDKGFSAFIFRKRENVTADIMDIFMSVGKEKPFGAVLLAMFVFSRSVAIVAFKVFISLLLTHFLLRLIAKLDSNSAFPSIDTAMTTALYGSIALNVHLLSAASIIPVSILCVAVVFFVGFSRVYLGADRLSDAIGGWSLGAFTGLLAAMIL